MSNQNERHRQKHIQKFFEERAQGLDYKKQRKRASKLRRAEQKKSRSGRRKVRRDDWEGLIEGDAPAFEERQRPSGSTDEWFARLERDAAAGDAGESTGAELADGLVVFVTAGACRVEHGGERVDCALSDDLRRRQRSALAVGDRVRFDAAARRVGEVLPRATRLSRPDPHRPSVERVLAANVDLALVVASLREPALSVGLVERVVLAVRRGGATPLVCASKLDLARDPARELAPLAPLRATGVEAVACSARTGEGLAELRARVAGRTCVLVGHSGVGKSSLLNALAPELALAVGRVRAADGKGRHTTTASALFALADGTRVIDTPGIREFGLWRVTPAELREAFPDLAEHADRCRYRDCTHDHEPDCGVRAAVADGTLSAARHRSYLRILATLER